MLTVKGVSYAPVPVVVVVEGMEEEVVVVDGVWPGPCPASAVAMMAPPVGIALARAEIAAPAAVVPALSTTPPTVFSVPRPGGPVSPKQL